MVKLNRYIVTGIGGSDITLPSTIDHAQKYSRAVGGTKVIKDVPIMGKLSVVYNCINKCIFD